MADTKIVRLLTIIILVPSAPPQSVTAGVINATSAWIRWEPPPATTWNGELTGYLVTIVSKHHIILLNRLKRIIVYNYDL